MTAIDRRTALAGAMAFGSIALSAPTVNVRVAPVHAQALSCFGTRSGSFGVAALDSNGIAFESGLPGRGHAVVRHPARKDIAVIARRPGDWIALFHADHFAPLAIVRTPVDRHALGHGVYSRDGSFLYVTENDYENARGVIGIYNARNGYTRVGEFPSYGVGPHELVLDPESGRLLVANGGIHTHPATGRAKLNLDTMRPNVAAIDPATGMLRASWVLSPALHQMSLRHLRALPGGGFVVGAQFEGPADIDAPLVFQLNDDRTGLVPVEFDPSIYNDMARYCGSVALSDDGGKVAISAPRGGKIIVSSLGEQQAVSAVCVEMSDGCGVGFAGRNVMMTSGIGEVRCTSFSRDGVAQTVFSNTADHLMWDNHLTIVPG